MSRGRHERLAKRWPRKMAKAKSGSRRRVVFARTLGTQAIDVLGVLGEGTTAVVFSCKIHEDKRDVAVKIEHQVRAYFPSCLCRVFFPRHRTEGTCCRFRRMPLFLRW